MKTPKRTSPYVWTRKPPTKAGRYWFMWKADGYEVEMVTVYREPGEIELTVQYGPEDDDTDWVVNMASHAVWAGPVPEPIYPDGGFPEEGTP